MEVEGDTKSQLKELWQHILQEESQVAKRPNSRQDSTPKGPKRHKPRATETSDPDLKNMVKLMAALVIRHEDQIATLESQDKWILHLGLGQGSIAQRLLLKSQQWQQCTAKTGPLRQTLAVEMISVLLTRFQPLLAATPETTCFATAAREKILTQEGSIPFLQWDAKANQTIISNQTPIPKEEMNQLLLKVQEAFQDPHTVVKLHSMKKMPEDPDSTGSIPWCLILSNRVHLDLWDVFQKLSYSAIWQLVDMRVKPAKQQRSSMANSLVKNLRQL